MNRENMFFSTEKINSGRQNEFDTVKTISIIIMIGIHVLESILASVNSPLSNLFLYYGNHFAAATVFMFMMGAGTVYTRHSSPDKLAERGILIITFGWILNFIRFSVPQIIFCLVSRSPEALNGLTMYFTSDILFFAGLAFLALALFTKFRLSSLVIFIISIGMSILGTILIGCQTGFYPLDQLLGFFWGTYTESYFPFLSWFIFVAAGRFYGEFYIRLKEKRKLHLSALPVGLILSAAFILLSQNPQQHVFLIATEMTGYSWIRLPDAIGCIIIAMTLISLVYIITGGRRFALCSFVSGNINKYYCVSWAVISTISLLYKGGFISIPENDISFLILLVFIFVLTSLIVLFYKKNLEQRFNAFFGKHKKGWICAVWIFAIAFIVFSFSIATAYPNMFNGYLMNLRS